MVESFSHFVSLMLVIVVFFGCHSDEGKVELASGCCVSNDAASSHGINDLFLKEINALPVDTAVDLSDLLGRMVLIPGGVFNMGASDLRQALPRELPVHPVKVDSFFMDPYEVTNNEFQKFIDATQYVTLAERPIDWSRLKSQLPENTARPPDSLLAPGSMVFQSTNEVFSMTDHSQWWSWVKGACWRSPFGPGSTLDTLGNYPVVHISYFDALAYAHWSGKSLPTEAQWEWAARGGLQNQIYPWGNRAVDEGSARCNYWTGHFPSLNTSEDGYEGIAPIGQYEPNGFGLFDMAGNVWEICGDWYDGRFYSNSIPEEILENPQGPSTWKYSMEPLDPKRVMRGGSFLCNDSYCASYRVSARMAFSQETGMSHIGFRCVKNTAGF